MVKYPNTIAIKRAAAAHQIWRGRREPRAEAGGGGGFMEGGGEFGGTTDVMMTLTKQLICRAELRTRAAIPDSDLDTIARACLGAALWAVHLSVVPGH